jgi:hypothetical protein
MLRAVGWITHGSGALLLLSTLVGAQGGRPTARAGVVTRSDLGDRLRVFATPGDYKLQNAAVTAVVRRRDGWLTELWRNQEMLPTTPQLGTLTRIDALWQAHPIVRLGETSLPVMAERVALLAGAIEVEGTADSGAVVYRALTRYELHPSEPRLTMTTRFSVQGGSAAGGGVGLGDALRWGNVEYVVDGVRKRRIKYAGRARFIGRRGAGGDLVLYPKSSEALWVDYGGRTRGFQGEIAAIYHRTGIPAGGSVTVSRELVFEPLPPLPISKEPSGALELSIADEVGKPLPAKLTLEREGYPGSLFPDDGDIQGVDRFVWTGNGQLSSALPAGRYRLLVTSGIERDAHRERVEIRAGEVTRAAARLPRVIATPGWIAADLHLHQAPSIDADISLENRVISVAAEGVEFAVASDHYAVTDLAPAVRWLRKEGLLTAPLATVIGTEVSTVGKRFGHFNVFPLALGQSVEYTDTTPERLFADARKKSPAGVLQVNHPRMGMTLGYFTHFGLDKNSGAPLRPGYSPAFDTIEVYNGDEAGNLKQVKSVLADWIHLLGRGHRYAATGGSDSHKLGFLDPGLPRTLVRHGAGSSDSTDPEAPPARVIEALKAGRSIVTSGPVIEASIDGKGPGETATGVGSRARLRVVVRAAPWIDVAMLEVLEGGRGRRLHWTTLPRERKLVRLDRSFEIPVTGKTFVVVVAQGERAIPNVFDDQIRPFAFTNPIWIEP